MKTFFGDELLLTNETAGKLYGDFAKDMPIIDYHCHLNPEDMVSDRHFTDLTDLWLSGDHYKWRAMRQNGVDESLITGNGNPRDKFRAFAETMSYAPGNPLYYWSHMELASLFSVRKPLNRENADYIFDCVKEQIGSFSALGLIKRFDVKVICTTDDPADDLSSHKKLRSLDFVKVLPTFRPDIACIGLNRPDFCGYIEKLGLAAGKKINDIDDLLYALSERLNYFISLGTKIADHALGTVPPCKGTYEDAKKAFAKALSGEKVPEPLLNLYTDFVTRFLSVRYGEKGIAMQLHMAPLRNVNSRLFRALGPDSGIDVVGDCISAAALGRFLNDINEEGPLPKMIFYCLNSGSENMIAAMTGAFSGDIPGKMQLGSAWWFNDHVDGIRSQLHALANAGLLGRFVGMLTDSRSFTSYVRFDFFRRILCSELGTWIENGEFDADCGNLVKNICYYNAKEFLL